jgi:prepilin-type N-terminal cleavage/methylation domain-containing protein
MKINRPIRPLGVFRAGFSMIELLAVMMILSILMIFLAFRLGGLGEDAKRNVTEQFLQQVSVAISSYEGEMGDYPSSSWQTEWGVVPNKSNLGSEALCIQLWGKDYGGSGISDDMLGNSDDDQCKKSLTTHANNNLFELVDNWGNPIAYFHRRDYEREDAYFTMDDTGVSDLSSAIAVKNPKTGNYFNPRGFQLISAGSDGVFDTEDDLYNFAYIREE